MELHQVKPSKYYLLRHIESMIQGKGPRSILDLGSGRSLNFEKIIEGYPSLSYTGVEPDKGASAAAKERFSGRANARFINALAYSDHPALAPAYDIVVSLSVLEHVKHLDRFLSFAALKTAPGGWCIHLYDLGHALHPSSWKERIQVALCNNPLTRWMIPEHKFAAYVSVELVTALLRKNGLIIEGVTHHNNPENVRKIKSGAVSLEALEALAHEEVVQAERIADTKERDYQYPAVCVWARRP